MSLTIRQRDTLEYAHTHPVDPTLRHVRLEANHRPIPRRMYRIARRIYNGVLIAMVGALIYGAAVALFSLERMQ